MEIEKHRKNSINIRNRCDIVYVDETILCVCVFWMYRGVFRSYFHLKVALSSLRFGSFSLTMILLWFFFLVEAFSSCCCCRLFSSSRFWGSRANRYKFLNRISIFRLFVSGLCQTVWVSVLFVFAALLCFSSVSFEKWFKCGRTWSISNQIVCHTFRYCIQKMSIGWAS